MSERTSRTILVADDDEGVMQIFGRMPQREGYQIRTARTGPKEVEDSRPDAIMLDLRMPLVAGRRQARASAVRQ